MKLGILTSIETRHRFFVQALRRRFCVAAVGYEETGYSPFDTAHSDLTPEETLTVTEHFQERARQEEVFFGHDCEFVHGNPAWVVRHIPPGALNSRETLAFLIEARVDTVVVYGTNLIKPPLLTRWPGRMVNMHLGLSPYYRGTATNFYPLLNEEPQYVGATIHLLDAGIDSGPILRHARPEIVADDMPHTIGCKAILAGIDALIYGLEKLDAGGIEPVPQWYVDKPRLYLRKDFHPRQIVSLHRKIEAGLIRRYVERPPTASEEIRLVR